ncbi:MAG: hypothetical protein K6V97_11350 [Actinomycetia bacterium]|nr:hypothetical protein [Actinomycetes bacterium]
MPALWTLDHLGWLVYDLGRFARHPNTWTLLALALAAGWFLTRRAGARRKGGPSWNDRE